MEVNMKSYYKYTMAMLLLIMVIISLVGCSVGRAQVVENEEQNDESIINEQNLTITFTLQTGAKDGHLYYTGVGGDINGVINPDLHVLPGTTIRVVLINGDGMPHDIFFPDFDAKSDPVMHMGDQTELTFQINENISGEYVYYCTFPGHRQAGQEGILTIDQP